MSNDSIMRILIFNWRDVRHDWAGGGEVYVHELAKRWVKAGHKVTLFCGQNFGIPLPGQEMIDGVRIIRRGGRFSVYFWAFFYYVRELRKSVDVVVDVQNGIPFFTPLFCRKPKLAVVYHIHGKQFFIELPFPINIVGYCIERYIFPLFYRRIPIQAISQTTKQDLINLGIPSKNISIVYCGTNGKRSKRKKQKKYSTPTILYLGRIKKYKRVDILVHIMPEIIKHIPKVKLIIAGWGTEASSVVDVSMRSRIRKHIRIIGPVTEAEKRTLLSRSWVFVNPSMNEGWSISVLEANFYGTPAVAFRVQGLSESINDGMTGKLASDQNELVTDIIKLLKNDRMRLTMGKRAVRWAQSFSWEDSSKDSLLILSRLLQRKNRQRRIRI